MYRIWLVCSKSTRCQRHQVLSILSSIEISFLYLSLVPLMLKSHGIMTVYHVERMIRLSSELSDIWGSKYFISPYLINNSKSFEIDAVNLLVVMDGFAQGREGLLWRTRWVPPLRFLSSPSTTFPPAVCWEEWECGG